MNDIAAQRPHFLADEAVKIAAEFFGREIKNVKPLPSERDQNFFLEDSEGQAFVLKIAGAAEDETILDMQNKVLEHLAKSGPGPYFQDVCPAISGADIVQILGASGRRHMARLLTWLPGVPLARVNPHSAELLWDSGRKLGEMDQALLDFAHPALDRELAWDMERAEEVIRRHITLLQDVDQRALIDRFLARFEDLVLPRLTDLRHSAVHNDGNDYNLLVSEDKKVTRKLTGIIDFGDMVSGCTVFEIAIAAAYVMLDKRDPFSAAGHLVSGYHSALPLTDLELELLPHLIAIRLSTSVVLSALQQALEPQNAYLSISERPAWNLLRRLNNMPPILFEAILRRACGLEPYQRHPALVSWLRQNEADFAPVLPIDLHKERVLVWDWGVGSLDMGSVDDFHDAPKAADLIRTRLEEANVRVGVGRTNEARLVYRSGDFRGDYFERRSGKFDKLSDREEQCTIHIGMDLFMPPGTAVYAPLEGVVHSFQDNDAPLDYGPTIILQHEPEHGPLFYTLYGHLSRESLEGLHVGLEVNKGQTVGVIGETVVNGGWTPHLHFQICGDMLGLQGDFPGAVTASRRAEYISLCPDPNLILGIPNDQFPQQNPSKGTLLKGRAEYLGPSLSISYQEPLEIVRGWRQYLYDENGRAYLDVVNNVAHVGHSHPHVVKALARQAAVLNTNTRYLHPNIVQYAQRLLALMPGPLEVVFFVCSGSEANELALRLARNYTGSEDMIVVDGAYHGNTQALIEISPYKHDGPGGKGTPAHVHKVLMPDPYRGRYKGTDRQAGTNYAQDVGRVVAEIRKQNKGLAGFICESLLGCGGQIVLPDGYLVEAFALVRAAGGVCIADEVQVGFGRVGSHFWGFETQGVVPDIVTMGKPIGNGHPLAAVVTTRAIADAFANGMEYFNTFGGNPVSCAVGSAVLDVLEREALQENARRVGEKLRQDLVRLMDRHRIIGDVRGLGLFLGIELVMDRSTLAPAAAEATYIVERMKEEGILLSIDGPLHNVLKLKPPIVFNEDDGRFLVETLDKILAEDPAQV